MKTSHADGEVRGSLIKVAHALSKLKDAVKIYPKKHYTFLIRDYSEPDHLVDICFLGFDAIEVACARQENVNMNQRWCIFIKLKTPVTLKTAVGLIMNQEAELDCVPTVQACANDFKSLATYKSRVTDWYHSYLSDYVKRRAAAVKENDLFCHEEMLSGQEMVREEDTFFDEENLPVIKNEKDALAVLNVSPVPMTATEVGSKLGINYKLASSFIFTLEEDGLVERTNDNPALWKSVWDSAE